MVHALAEIRRVLVSDGVLIDLRPLADQWPVEVASLREVQEVPPAVLRLTKLARHISPELNKM